MGRTAGVGLAVWLVAVAAVPARGASSAARPAPPGPVDLAIVIDVSGSARAASGVDVDGDGTVGINPQLDSRLTGRYPKDVVSTDPDDSVLAAELAAVRALLGQLDGAGGVRVAVVAFSGHMDPEKGTQSGPPDQNARIVAPLGGLPAARAALDDIARRGPSGGTDFSAAIGAARKALCDAPARAGATRHALLLTDGVPSLPFGFATRTDPSDVSAAITAAHDARDCGVRIDVFAIGLGATGDPFASKEVSRITGGVYRPIRATGALREALEGALTAAP
ncbi:MAG: VWA domain-containing protein [Deltaproteobacteria bacterium]|nr:VWA domain-containing protein [Deltaproteobacteria bacterium]